MTGRLSVHLGPLNEMYSTVLLITVSLHEYTLQYISFSGPVTTQNPLIFIYDDFVLGVQPASKSYPTTGGR